MRHAEALASELSLVSSSDLTDRRGDAIARLIHEFERQAPSLNEQAIELYDVALRWLVADLEQTALAALSERLADIPNAPVGVIRILAYHDDLSIAGPVLGRSPRLDPDDLIAIIGEKGQEHILVIARRADLTAPVTDQLIARGSAQVLQTLAANGRAALSEDGRSILVKRAGADHRLAMALAERFHLPAALRERLLDDASSILQAHLSLVIPNAPAAAVAEAVAASLDASSARVVSGGSTTEEIFLDLLRRRRLREALDVIAREAAVAPEAAETVFAGDDFDLMLTLLRAGGLSWAATEETLVARANGADRAGFRDLMRRKFHAMSRQDALRRAAIVGRVRAAAPAATRPVGAGGV